MFHPLLLSCSLPSSTPFSVLLLLDFWCQAASLQVQAAELVRIAPSDRRNQRCCLERFENFWSSTKIHQIGAKLNAMMEPQAHDEKHLLPAYNYQVYMWNCHFNSVRYRDLSQSSSTSRMSTFASCIARTALITRSPYETPIRCLKHVAPTLCSCRWGYLAGLQRTLYFMDPMLTSDLN